ncbi:MAG TPA: hypothetical protein VGB15_01540 [Longimicrobium sp.]|jgi:hypothetical protein
MIIACTHDLAIRASLSLPSAAAWGTVILLGAEDSQAAASAQLTQSLGNMAPGEPLCVAAHQAGADFGDADGVWAWSPTDFVVVLQQGVPKSFKGPLLIYAVSPEVATFASDLVAALRSAGALCGVTVYGFKKAVEAGTPYPSPQQLSTNPDLTGIVVNC